MKKQTGVLMLGGVSSNATDIRYLSGFTAGDPFLCLHTLERSLAGLWFLCAFALKYNPDKKAME